ncbi:hypothetical protein B0H16DRAFT_479760 [Mycena metata]|uniref:F-box domain-containing protein n=1 Tax=Mycena metata TaxID=1033252 RepID=A0AAD7P0M8_9AGAR|nr:hypothetical protein B0H16DRAFT_479760 [Mycena metata]
METRPLIAFRRTNDSSIVDWLPLDVVLLVLRLLPVRDVMSLFLTCNYFSSVSKCRMFWVYANIDLDFFYRKPDRGRTDYSGTTTIALQHRILHAQHRFNAWRRKETRARCVRTLPIRDGVRLLLLVRLTPLVVVVWEDSVSLKNWDNGISNAVPLRRGVDRLLVFDVKIFWVATIRRNVIAVTLTNRHQGPPIRNELQLFAVQESQVHADHLITIHFRNAISEFAVNDTHLAVVGRAASGVYYIESIGLDFDPPVTSFTKGIACVGTTPRARSLY